MCCQFCGVRILYGMMFRLVAGFGRGCVKVVVRCVVSVWFTSKPEACVAGSLPVLTREDR